jgi:hypothetical protein
MNGTRHQGETRGDGLVALDPVGLIEGNVANRIQGAGFLLHRHFPLSHAHEIHDLKVTLVNRETVSCGGIA